jgi:acyl carrier protein
MDREAFLLEFKDQFIDADEISVTWTKPFREIGSFDSLTGMAIIVMIKDVFGVDISEQEFKSCLTPAEMYDLVVSKAG